MNVDSPSEKFSSFVGLVPTQLGLVPTQPGIITEQSFPRPLHQYDASRTVQLEVHVWLIVETIVLVVFAFDGRFDEFELTVIVVVT